MLDFTFESLFPGIFYIEWSPTYLLNKVLYCVVSLGKRRSNYPIKWRNEGLPLFIIKLLVLKINSQLPKETLSRLIRKRTSISYIWSQLRESSFRNITIPLIFLVLVPIPHVFDQDDQLSHSQLTVLQVQFVVRCSCCGSWGQDWGKPSQLSFWTVVYANEQVLVYQSGVIERNTP